MPEDRRTITNPAGVAAIPPASSEPPAPPPPPGGRPYVLAGGYLPSAKDINDRIDQAYAAGRRAGRQEAARSGCLLCNPGTPEEIEAREQASARLLALLEDDEPEAAEAPVDPQEDADGRP